MDETTPATPAPSGEAPRGKPPKGEKPAQQPAAKTEQAPAQAEAEHLVDERDGKKTPEEWAAITGRVIGASRGVPRSTGIAINGVPVPSSAFSAEHRAAAVLKGWQQGDGTLITREQYERAVFEAKHDGNLEAADKAAAEAAKAEADAQAAAAAKG